MNEDPKRSDPERVNILLVDDQPAKLLTYEAILGDLGEELVTAASAKDALQQLLKRDFAVILVDVCMPEQDGFELAEMIRAHHRFNNTAIIFVSAIQLTDVDFIKGYATGGVDYVSVPIIPEVLRAKVAIFVELYRKNRQLANVNEELEARVRERTAKLQETEEALREADRRKDLFLATLAHELRNPLAPMQSALDLMRLQPANDQCKKHSAEVFERQLRQMTRLIDDLMDLTRITRNTLELRKGTVDPQAVLQSAIEAAMPAIEESQHRLELDIERLREAIVVDPARLSQVVANLLNNAAKYTPRGGNITLGAYEENGEVFLSVRDDGIGIEPEHQLRLFDAFYQVKDPATGSGGGLGIGLTLVRTIVELHGGCVVVSSDGAGKGTLVTIRIPAGKVPDERSEPADRLDIRELRKRRILVVDDNKDAAHTLGLVLTELGNEVLVVEDGDEAISRAQPFKPDVIVMDLGMPRKSGYDTIREMKELDFEHEPFYVAVSGWGQQADRERTTEAGFHRHLVKPVSVDTLTRLFSELDAMAGRTGRDPVQT